MSFLMFLPSGSLLQGTQFVLSRLKVLQLTGSSLPVVR